MSQEQGSVAAQIRAWLGEHGKPATTAEVSAGASIPLKRVTSSLCDMVRLGHVVAEGAPGKRSYTLSGSAVKVWRYPPELRKVKRLEAQSRGRRKKGIRSIAEIRAEMAKRRAAEEESARLKKLAAEVAAANAARAKQQAQRKQEHAAADRREASRAGKARLSDALAGAPARHDDFPDTEAFIRQNPDKLIRLPPGEWSSPLRFTY